ncbi:uncharacterized protein isoform X1 [Rhodnius prolixus]|uniref:uncharacterized protein isoform X1 n=1 Tax=Rhodnius prolixus TaxID=13249 RepID=UPI003D18F3B6
MYPFRRRRNYNGYEENGKSNGRTKLLRNDQGEPTFEIDDKFNYNQKDPTVYEMNKAGTSLAEKEKVLMASIKDTEMRPSSGNIKTPLMYVKDIADNNLLPHSLNCKGPKRLLTSERSTS